MVFDNIDYELYAIVVLKNYWDKYQEGFEKSERPDWINKNYSVGFEVTNAIDQFDGQRQAKYNKGTWRNEDGTTEIKKYTNANLESQKTVVKIQSIFTRKLKKLNELPGDDKEPFCSFEKNALFIYISSFDVLEYRHMLYDLWPRVMDEQESYKKKYDIVFLNRMELLYGLALEEGIDYEMRVSACTIDTDACQKEEQQYRASKEWQCGDSFE